MVLFTWPKREGRFEIKLAEKNHDVERVKIWGTSTRFSCSFVPLKNNVTAQFSRTLRKNYRNLKLRLSRLITLQRKGRVRKMLQYPQIPNLFKK